MRRKELSNAGTFFFWTCLVVAGMFIYGKYFVAVTELDKAYYSISAMLWILLGLMLRHMSNTSKNEAVH